MIYDSHLSRLWDARNELLLWMSRARRAKKASRYFEYELEYPNVHIFYGGPWEAHARRSRMRDKSRHGGGWDVLYQGSAPVKHGR